MRWLIMTVGAAFVCGAVPVQPAVAGTVTNSMGSSAVVTSACSVSGSTLNFGNALNPVSVGATAVDATSTLTVQCTATTPYSISLNAGINTGGGSNFSGRVLKSGSHSLPYQLYVNSGRTSVWGNGTGSALYSDQGTGNAQNVVIYGRLPSLAGIAPGTYTDTVTVTVTY